MNKPRYIIITPARNEDKFLPGTIDSIASQTVRPVRWIIVNDGSTDATGKISDEATERHDWIEVIHRKDRGFRRAGGGVMEAFYDAMKLVEGVSWQYLVKLDGDVTLAPDYFEACFNQFAADSKLGVGGGLVCNVINGEVQPESKIDPAFHVRGATKIYRRQCWDDIGGLVRATGWDTLDEFKANMMGWTSRTFPEIKLIHHRPAGGAYGTWPNWVKNGHANYVAGYHPLFMMVKCAKRVFNKPYFIGATGLAAGYFGGYLKRVPQIDDVRLINYLRREQMKRLLWRSSLWG
jgi:glycosyltransferase involved in cell wall biosynthesis